MTTNWNWVTISDEIKLALTLDSDDPEVIARVEQSAEANGITLVRIDEQAAADRSSEAATGSPAHSAQPPHSRYVGRQKA